MKITLYNPLGATQGHAQEYIDNICAGLVFQGAEVVLVTTDDYEIADPELKEQITKGEVFGGAGSTIKSLRYGLWLLKTGINSFSTLTDSLHQRKPDVCLMVGGSSLVNAVILPFFVVRFRDIKFGLTLHNVDLDWRLHDANFVKKIYKFLQVFFTKLTGRIGVNLLCHGEYMMMRAQGFLKSKKYKIDHYPVPSVKIQRSDTERTSPSVPVILFFGVVRHDKGLDILANALKELTALSWHLVVAGSADQVGQNYVHDCIKQLPTDRVTTDLRYFSNQQRDEFFEEASLVCLPYRKTFIAQSVVMVDAMRFGKPVVTTKDSENGFNTIKYGTGWTFESENVEELVSTLKTGLVGLSSIEVVNFEKFNDDHTPETVGKKILSIFGAVNGY